MGENLYNPWNLREADCRSSGEVANVDLPHEGEEVMFTE
jgi:hypothetical protein